MLQNVTWKICIIPFHDPRAIIYWRIQIGHKSVFIVNIKTPRLIFDWYFQGTLTKLVLLLMRNVQNMCQCFCSVHQVTTPAQQFLAKNTESKLTYRHVFVGTPVTLWITQAFFASNYTKLCLQVLMRECNRKMICFSNFDTKVNFVKTLTILLQQFIKAFVHVLRVNMNNIKFYFIQI